MKTKTTAAISLLLCAIFAFPQASLADRGGPKEDPTRNPSKKDCTFVYLYTGASEDLNYAYHLIEGLSTNDEVFTSKEQDAKTLMCKVSGAEIKLAQNKDPEASELLYVALLKIDSLELEGKLEDFDGGVRDAIAIAKSTVDNL